MNGLQPRPLRALVRAFLALALRGAHYGQATNTKAGERIPPLFWVVGQFLTAQLLICAVLLGRVDPWAFAWVTLTAQALLVGSAMVVELDEVALAPSDREVIGPRPVSAITYAAARWITLLVFVAGVGGAAAIFPAVVGAWVWGVGYALAWSAAALSVTVCVSSAVVLLETALGFGAALERIKAGLAWTQILLILVAFYGGQLLLRHGEGRFERWLADPPVWVELAPTVWASRWVVAESARDAALWVGLSGLVAVWTVLRLARAYAALHVGGAAARAAQVARLRWPLSLSGGWRRRALGSREAGAAYGWVRILVQRDGGLRARTWPHLGIAVATVVLGVLTGQLGDPFVVGVAQSALPVATIAGLAYAAPLIVHNLGLGAGSEARWVLETAPVGDGRGPSATFQRGVRWAVWVTFFAPCLVAYGVVLGVVWGAWLHAAAQVVVAGLVVDGALRVSCARSRFYPASRPLVVGEATGGVVLWAAVVTAGGSFVVTAHAAAAHAGGWGWAAAGAVAAWWLVRRWTS